MGDRAPSPRGEGERALPPLLPPSLFSPLQEGELLRPPSDLMLVGLLLPRLLLFPPSL